MTTEPAPKPGPDAPAAAVARLNAIREVKMMFKGNLAVFIMVLGGFQFLAAPAALALTEVEVRDLAAAAPGFARAEKRLAEAWAGFPQSFRDELQAEQEKWLESGRDKQAQAFLSHGLSRAQAYELVNDWRWAWLSAKKAGKTVALVRDANLNAAYDGEKKNGYAHGEGTAVGVNFFFGQFANGWQTDGLYVFPGGDSYKGQYEKDKRHGQGTYLAANGERYFGKYQAGKKHGGGLYTRPDGYRYVGEYRDGVRHGTGVQRTANGEHYAGEYQNDKRHGRGLLLKADGRLYVVEYRQGEQTGPEIERPENAETKSMRETILTAGEEIERAIAGEAVASKEVVKEAAEPLEPPAPAEPVKPPLPLPLVKARYLNLNELNRQAEGGDGAAWIKLARLYALAGQDYKAREAIDKAAKTGKPAGLAFEALGRFLEAAEEAEKIKAAKELKKVWSDLEDAAEGGETEAMNIAGEIYARGWQTVADPSFFKSLFGGTLAEPEPDLEKALAWFQKSAQAGDQFGKLALGRLYFSGQGVKEDSRLALKLFQEADPNQGLAYGLAPLAEKGQVKAQMELAGFYGRRGETEKAREWIQKAADSGQPEALFHLALFHGKGKEAAQLYQRAGEAGYESAYIVLAFLDADNGEFGQARQRLEAGKRAGLADGQVQAAQAEIGRLAEKAQKEAEAERKRAQEERERAEAERRRLEEQAHACDHVYPGKVWVERIKEKPGIFDIWGPSTYPHTFTVIGFSRATQEATVAESVYGSARGTRSMTCSRIPR